MQLSTPLRLMTALALAGSAACSGDLPSAPAAPSLDVAAPSLGRGDHGRGESTRSAKGRRSKDADYSSYHVVTLRVDPKVGATYRISSHWVRIPANVICSQDSGYGVHLWDAPCVGLATEPMELTVEVVHENGRSSVRFDKDLRFKPSNRWSEWVVLGLRVNGDMSKELGYGILYQPEGSDEWIDESLTDPSLRAFRLKGHVVARRLKHFSGYNVSLGFDEQAPVGFGEIGGGQ